MSDRGIVVSCRTERQGIRTDSNIRSSRCILTEGEWSDSYIECSTREHSERPSSQEDIISIGSSHFYDSSPGISTSSRDTVAMRLDIAFNIEGIFWNRDSDTDMTTDEVGRSIFVDPHFIDPSSILTIREHWIFGEDPFQSMHPWREIECREFPIRHSRDVHVTGIGIETKCKDISPWLRARLPLE